MELQNNRREGFKVVMREWFKEKRTLPMDELETEIRSNWGEWGIKFIGMEWFGETLTMGGEWNDEGVVMEVNINPNVDEDEFRVLFRWR